ncbi:MAG: hypothetical protein ACTSYC_08690 [Promethearchaeota archaeon]
MELNLLQIFQGTFSLIYVIISTIVSIVILSHYLSNKRLEFILVGVAIFGLAGPWIPDAITFLVIIFTNFAAQASFYLEFTIRMVLITTAFTPISIICWLGAITKFLGIKYRKIILIIFTILMIIFEIFLFAFYFMDISLLGNFHGPFDYQWSMFTTIFYLFCIFLVILTGLPFATTSMRANAKNIQLKGKFILLALISFAIGALIPYIVYNIPALVISRLILVSCAFEFYIGFLLPKWAEKLFLRKES